MRISQVRGSCCVTRNGLSVFISFVVKKTDSMYHAPHEHIVGLITL
jgi:hypothetical protein